MTGKIECRYYGRDFTAGEMALLRALIAGPPPLNRHMLSKEFCRRIGWFKPDGGLKDMMARVAMLAMHRDGLIALPAPRGRQNRPGPIVFGPDTEPPMFPAPTTLDEVRPLDLRPVMRGTREGKLWNEFVARYHYLGYKTLVGAQMRYAVHDRNGWPLACQRCSGRRDPLRRMFGWGRRRSEGARGFRSTSRVPRWRASSSSLMTTASWSRGSGNDSPGSHAFGSRGRRSWIWLGTTGRLSNEVAPDRERGRVRGPRRWSAGHVRYRFMASGGAGRAGCGGRSHEVETG